LVSISWFSCSDYTILENNVLSSQILLIKVVWITHKTIGNIHYIYVMLVKTMTFNKLSIITGKLLRLKILTVFFQSYFFVKWNNVFCYTIPLTIYCGLGRDREYKTFIYCKEVKNFLISDSVILYFILYYNIKKYLFFKL